MTIQGVGSRELVAVTVPPNQTRHARIAVEGDGESAVVSMSSNSLRVLAKLADAAADELDARSVAP